jgi:hypothetical protein
MVGNRVISSWISAENFTERARQINKQQGSPPLSVANISVLSIDFGTSAEVM